MTGLKFRAAWLLSKNGGDCLPSGTHFPSASLDNARPVGRASWALAARSLCCDSRKQLRGESRGLPPRRGYKLIYTKLKPAAGPLPASSSPAPWLMSTTFHLIAGEKTVPPGSIPVQLAPIIPEPKDQTLKRPYLTPIPSGLEGCLLSQHSSGSLCFWRKMPGAHGHGL